MKAIFCSLTLLVPAVTAPAYAQAPQAKVSQPETKPMDTVKLANGDQLKGRVLKVDSDTIVLQSDTLGRLTLPRAKVAEIHLGQNRSSPTGRATAEPANEPSQPRVSD